MAGEKMNFLKKFENTMWMLIKFALYIMLLLAFMLILARENPALLRLSRTMGITITTFVIVGTLFLTIYGKYDVGRRKSKPIIYSLVLATLFTDIVTYLQLMIMKTITTLSAFRLRSISLIILVYIVQIFVIVLFVYGGNALFFILHEPESCCIITSSQKSLNCIAWAVGKYKKQYRIDYVVDYRDKNALRDLPKVDTIFIYDIPVIQRSEILRYCYEKNINVYFNPEIEDVVEMNAQSYMLDDISVLNRNVKHWTMEQRIAKKAMDVVLAIVLLIITSPICLITAIVIKAHDGGNILFKQKRATLHGKTFEVYKFRTMKENVENKSAVKGDDRITSPGKFLRKTRIDELPQLINILRGDMSFVGPRPEMLENVLAYQQEIPEFRYRLRVKAGLTGYAQIAGKYNTSPRDKLIMDMQYIEQFSIVRDIQLLFQTCIVLLKSDSTEVFYANKQKTQYVFRSVIEKDKDGSGKGGKL